jgi:hypothetical protein
MLKSWGIYRSDGGNVLTFLGVSSAISAESALDKAGRLLPEEPRRLFALKLTRPRFSRHQIAAWLFADDFRIRSRSEMMAAISSEDGEIIVGISDALRKFFLERHKLGEG